VSIELRITGLVVCASIAGVLAWRKTDGWGWFLFIGFVALVANP
jgi:uncharacterized membrane protein HdeD (DUF308 family)